MEKYSNVRFKSDNDIFCNLILNQNQQIKCAERLHESALIF